MIIMVTWGVAHSKRVFKSSTRFRPDLNIKSKTINSGMEGFMSSLLVIFVSLVLVSCSSLQNTIKGENKSPGYQYGRQMDERSLRASFMER